MYRCDSSSLNGIILDDLGGPDLSLEALLQPEEARWDRRGGQRGLKPWGGVGNDAQHASAGSEVSGPHTGTREKRLELLMESVRRNTDRQAESRVGC